MNTTKTTTHLRRVTSRRWYERYANALPLGITLAVFVVAGVLAALGRVPRVPASAPQPIILIATPRAVAHQPTPAAHPTQDTASTLPRALVAYSAPDGLVLGALEPGRRYRYAARSGADWMQLDVAGSGAVWVRSAELLGAGNLADLAPTNAPVAAYVAVQEGATEEVATEEPAIASDAAPAATIPAPTPWPTPSGPAAFVATFRPSDHAASCAFVGCLPGR